MWVMEATGEADFGGGACPLTHVQTVGFHHHRWREGEAYHLDKKRYKE